MSEYYLPTTQCIETPYRTSLQKDVCPNVWNTANVRMEFENMVKNGFNSDDVLINVTVKVTEPELTITDLVRGYDSIWISGKTTWSAGTELILKLDPDNYARPQDIRWHTWNTTINGTIDKWRTFSISCPIDTEELAIGSHDFVMSVTKNKYTTETTYTFGVSDVYVMPTPTRATERIIVDASGNKIAMSTTVIPTSPTPSPTYNKTTNTIIVNVTPVETRETFATPTTKPTPTPTKDPNIHVPLPVWVPIVAVGLGLLWRKRK